MPFLLVWAGLQQRQALCVHRFVFGRTPRGCAFGQMSRAYFNKVHTMLVDRVGLGTPVRPGKIAHFRLSFFSSCIKKKDTLHP